MSGKGDDYYVSEVTTGYNIQSLPYPWLLLFSYKKLSECNSLKYLKLIYQHETPFFLLLNLTLLTTIAFVYAILPQTIVLWLNSITVYSISFVAPMLFYSGVYLWAGLLLKRAEIFFSVKGCLLSCIILEVLMEVMSGIFALNINAESTISLAIITGIFIVTLTASGTFIETLNNIGTLSVVNSIILVRLMVIPNFTNNTDEYFAYFRPLLVYIYIITGMFFKSIIIISF